MTKTITAKSHELAEIQRIFALQKKHQYAIGRTTARERKVKLQKIHDAMLEYQTALNDAMFADFRKSSVEVALQDIYAVTGEVKHTMANLKSWMSPEKVKTPTAMMGAKSYIYQEPKGVALIISPWNFPINLTFGPLVSAIAAGNCVMVKPSELTPHTSKVIAEIIRSIFDEAEVAVFEGGVETSTALLTQPFNHIFFTGSPKVGKIVMRAAAEHLASVTLELGGKSPTIVDRTANLEEAATKIAWAKFSNNGQICIAPDYVFVEERVKSRFVNLLQQKIKNFYGETESERKTSPDYARIVNNRNFQRLQYLLEDAVENGAKIEIGGAMDGAENYISPTVLTSVSLEAAIMQEEIFGPILPVLSFTDINEPIDFINKNEKPLALYVYSRGGKNADKVLAETRAGGSCVNDSNIHFGNHHLPFGGSNNSGIGKSHGKFGFEAFSNARGILKQSTPFSAVRMMMPPYTDQIKKMVDLTLKWF